TNSSNNLQFMTKRNLLLDLQPFISEYSHYKKTVFNCLNTLKNRQ
ncbi:MAG: hypothetical protein ACI9Q9_001223, partial [Flavobacterium sp.]